MSRTTWGVDVSVGVAVAVGGITGVGVGETVSVAAGVRAGVFVRVWVATASRALLLGAHAENVTSTQNAMNTDTTKLFILHPLFLPLAVHPHTRREIIWV